MTREQIEKARQSLFNRGFTYTNSPVIVKQEELLPTDVVYKKLPNGDISIRNRLITDEMETEMEEINCRDMMLSILVYSYSREEFPASNSYLDKYKESLGIERVKELWKEMWTDFQRATVQTNVHTDSEGCSYNSVSWAD